jgi:SAM-dependent methyltransferase
MLTKLLPKGLRNYLNQEFRSRMQVNLQELMPCHQGYFTYEPKSRWYVLPKIPARNRGAELPVPPQELWIGYGQTQEEYVSSGMRDVQTMSRILSSSGASLESCARILDFGCGAGRMIRSLQPLADTGEIWGADILSTHITWCQQYLSPPFHFVTTTVFPHLPFEDRYFSLVYAGSVFTHVDDLTAAWFLELRRVLRPSGRLYITINDRRTVDILGNDQDTRSWIVRFRKRLRLCPEYDRFSRSDFGVFTIGRSVNSDVFYDLEYLGRKLKPFFKIISATEEAYGFQTGVLLERS